MSKYVKYNDLNILIEKHEADVFTVYLFFFFNCNISMEYQ